MDLIIRNAKVRNCEELLDIVVNHGVFEKIEPNIVGNFKTEIDAKGKLVSPPIIDPHIHLDKVNIFDEVRPNESGTLTEAIEIIWEKKKTYTDEDIVARSEKVVKQAITNGTLYMRTHIDVDTTCGLKAMSGVLKLKNKYKDYIDIQTIAFPQEGIVKDPGTEELMREAMKLGCEIVGGMPASENTPEDSLAHVEICFNIAKEFNADIDMHVDETDDPFYRTLEMIADETIKRGYEGRVTCGHTCALAAYDDHYAKYVIAKVKKAGIYMITNPVTNLMLQGRLDKQPIRRGITRVKELLASDITVCFGQDCVKDTFYPFGHADMLEVALIVAHAAQMSLPREIEKVFDMLTIDSAKILGIKNYGIKIGNPANFIIIDALDVRDAIRLQADRLYVFKNGKLLAKTVTNTSIYLD
ncbi:MAG: amidohydrolase family protein [Acidaminobacteraceae bacterium]